MKTSFEIGRNLEICVKKTGKPIWIDDANKIEIRHQEACRNFQEDSQDFQEELSCFNE